MIELELEMTAAKNSLTKLINKLHSDSTYLTWYCFHSLLDELSNDALTNHLKELERLPGRQE